MSNPGVRTTLPWVYLAAATLLAISALSVPPTAWQGSVVSHTLLEVAATLLALLVGAAAMIRFCTRQETLHLFVGVGFLGAALFDGYHAFLTSSWGSEGVSESGRWDWNPSQTFLALQLVFAWWACRRGCQPGQPGQPGQAPNNVVYVRLAVLTLVSFVVATFVPISRHYPVEGLFGRPDDLLAGALFLIALLGFLCVNERSPSVFLQWLTLALLISFVGRVFVMSRSQALFDALFMTGHVTKIACYSCIVVGLLIDFYYLSKEVQRGQESLAEAVGTLQREAAERERAQREVQAAHDALKVRAVELEDSRAAALNVLQDLDAARQTAVRAELAAREQSVRAQAILDGATDAIVTINSAGVIEAFNVAAERTFGYSASEVIGKNVKLLMPSPYRDEHDQHIRNYLATGVSRIIGVRRETLGLRADHTIFPIDLAVTEVVLGDERLFTGIIRDISELKHAMQQLTEASEELARRAQQIERFNVDLRRSNEELKQFAYVASHDLQEPLRKVTAFCQMLKDDYGDRLDANAQTYIRYAVDGALRMKTLVADLLDYSRVETQGNPLEPTDADDACAEAIQNLALAIDEAAAEITRDPLPVVRADRAQLVRLFQNLIGNAIKYRSQELPRIHVSAEESGGQWLFRVRDNGIGIDPQYHERVFVIFQRLHSRDEYSGTGIGLAVCRRIVERAGGRIWVESQAGAGSVFCFTLSKAVPALPQGAPSHDRHTPQFASTAD